MTNEVIFVTQILSIIGYIGAVFGLYRLLVSAKDSKIGLLEERIKARDDKIAELEKQTPDVLVTSLSSRVKALNEELERMLADASSSREAIAATESELLSIKHQLDGLSALIEDSDLVCPNCGAPLSTREYATIYGHWQGQEAEAESEIVQYDCGLILRDGREEHPCKGRPNNTA